MEDESPDLPEEKEEYRMDFKVLLKYLTPLVEEYPNPINQTELAKLANVSKPAITRIKYPLWKLCNKDIISRRQSKMVLELNKYLFLNILFFSICYGEVNNLPRLLESRYGKDVLKNLYKQVTSGFNPDMVPISEEDLERLVEILAENLKQYDSTKMKDAIKLMQAIPEENQGNYFGLALATQIKFILENFDLKIKAREDVLFYLKLRDKAYYVLHSIICAQIPEMNAIKKLESAKKRDAYNEMLKDIADFYLKELFSTIIEEIKKLSKGVEFPSNYVKIGAFSSHLTR